MSESPSKSRYIDRLRSRAKNPKLWLITLSGALVISLMVTGIALVAIRQLTEPPGAGQFKQILSEPPLSDVSNTTNTLFEDTVDKLSGGVIPVLLFPNSTHFCGDTEGTELRIGACVDPFNPTFISVAEGLLKNYNLNYEAATAAGKDAEAEEINQWERHLAAHEFAHVLQYNFYDETKPFLDKFEGGHRGSPIEDMAECYAQFRYPLSDDVAQKPGDTVTISFYNFPEPETFALCSSEQLNTIQDWLKAMPYPETNKL